MRRLRPSLDFVYPVMLLFALGAIWEWATAGGKIPKYILPSASDTVKALVANWPLLLENALSTTVAIIAGFGLSVVIGVGFGLLIVGFKPIEKSVYPLLVGSQAIPKIALAPIFVVWFGFELTPRIIMAFLIAFFPMVIATVTGMRAIEPELVHVSRCMGLRPIQRLLKVRLPNSLPYLFSGMKVAIALSAVGAVVGEFVGSDSGLGNIMIRAIAFVNTPLLFASIILLTAIAIVLFVLVGVIERFAIPWHVSQRT